MCVLCVCVVCVCVVCVCVCMWYVMYAIMVSCRPLNNHKHVVLLFPNNLSYDVISNLCANCNYSYLCT